MTLTGISKPLKKVGCNKINRFRSAGKTITQYDNTIVIKNKYGNRSVIYTDTSRAARRIIKRTYNI